MRNGIIIIAILVLTGGCATSHTPERGVTAADRQAANLQYCDATAGTLAFDPPITQYGQHVNLSRESRQPTAFVGYDQTTTSSFVVVSDDRQIAYHGSDRFEHRTTSVTVGTSVR